MYKSFKFRLYPNKEQKELLNKSFGCSRFIYNYYLSIINNNGYINYKDIMDNFIKLVDNGEFTSLGYAFDVGNTITKSLNKYKETNDEISSGCGDLMDNGNGSLMRILPISIYCILNNVSDKEITNIISKSSSFKRSFI